MATSIQFGDDETPKQTSGAYRYEAKPAPKSTPVEGPQTPGVQTVDAGQRKYSMVGNGPVTQHGQGRYVAGADEASDNPLDHGKSQTGRPLARHELDENSLVTVGGSEGRIKELLRLGLVHKDANGLYQMAEQKVTEPKREEIPSEALSDQSEATIRQVVGRLGDGPVISLLQASVEGKDTAVERIINDGASRLGMEPAEFRAVYDSVSDEMQGQGQRALGMDEDTFSDFGDWCRVNKAGALQDAVLSMFAHGDLRGLKTLGEQFKASNAYISNEALADAQVPAGGQIYKASGKLALHHPRLNGGQPMWLRDAIKQGVVKVRPQ